MARRPSNVVCLIFFSKTAWPIKAKFHMEPQWDGGTKFCLQGLGHMTKMATMPIYGNKSFSYQDNLPLRSLWYAFETLITKLAKFSRNVTIYLEDIWEKPF